ncbi:MAG: DUF2950 domain-containing protein [Pyrinomonadaceae bacterium]
MKKHIVAKLSCLSLRFVVIPAFLLGAAVVSIAQTGTLKGKAFLSADEAASAFILAAENFDVGAIRQILGPNSSDLLYTGEPARDRQVATEFAEQAKIKKSIIVDKRNRNRALLAVGEDSWPFPIPLVKQGKNWFFDVTAGREELLYRRIGRNELDAIDICRGFVEAQHSYALKKHDAVTVNQYAQRIISTPGKHDGLAWQNADGTWGGTVGERAAKALQESYSGTYTPFHGYYFKVLKGQGPAAPLGSMDFIVNGAMIGGFALLAYPSIYQVTGVKTFMVSHDGVVYEKDLGPNSIDLAKSIDKFDPDRSWKPVLDE